MKRNNLTRFIIVICVVLWSLYELYPPQSRDLTQSFNNRGKNRDATFTSIVENAMQMNKTNLNNEYANLERAIGTNDIVRYFPFIRVQTEARPTQYILNRLQRDAAGKVKLGIDLQGGTSFLVEMNTNALFSVETITNKLGQLETVTNSTSFDVSGALNQAIEVLRKRVDKFGVAEPVLQAEGANRILIQLPGLSQEKRDIATKTISKVAYLEFKLVHEQSDKHISERITPPGYEILYEVDEQESGAKATPRPYIVKKKPEMVGGIKYAGVSRTHTGAPQISFQLEPAAAALFGKITSENIGRKLAIVLDGELQTAPDIISAIEAGSGEITGKYSEIRARQLANVLENPLKAPLKIMNSKDVDPTLGKDTIRSGIMAALIGVFAVAGFMLIYYMLAGAVANVALILNIIILLGVMCSINTTLTMPGIAGIVLTIGMAVDANVLIFERIREESGKGKSLRGALQAGYDKAFGTIFDSHVTTLISSIILIFMGTGSVKGFGVTLTIGVAASLFTALVVTRLIFDWLLSKNWLKGIKMLHLIPATLKIDFMRLAMPAFIASWLLICIGMGYGIYRGAVLHNLLGVELAGGTTIILNVDPQNKVPVDKVREVAAKASGSEVLVAYQHDISNNKDTLSVTARHSNAPGVQEGVGDRIFQSLMTEFPEAKFGGETGKPLDNILVGPTVGEEIQRNAILASLFAMFGILIYVAFRYEFSFAVGAVVAIIHDILMTLGWYFLTGREMNSLMVAAVLTIIGFSINDTIVIFDRIREDLKLGVRGTFKEIMNQALNQTLSRTLITSGTVFLATLSLYLFGGGVINDFAFTFLVGIITGTYSSIYIASAIVLWWHKGQRPNIGGSQVIVQTTTPVKGGGAQASAPGVART